MTQTIFRKLIKTRSLWIVVALLLAAEMTVRLSLPEGKTPKGAFHSSEFRGQVEQYRKADPVDMLIVGSSVAAVNFPPVPLDERLAEQGFDSFTTFNAGIRGCNYDCIATGIRRHYLLEYRPPMVLFVISQVDLDADDNFVIDRSNRFAADMLRGSVGRAGRNSLSKISYLYGFKEEVRDWLTQRKWTFDPAILGDRGYVDMGSNERKRFATVANIKSDSWLSESLRALIRELADSGTHVVLMTVEGDLMAQTMFSDQAKAELAQFIGQVTQHPNVFELKFDTLSIPNSAYIDNSHLNSQSAIDNAKRLADELVRSGLLESL